MTNKHQARVWARAFRLEGDDMQSLMFLHDDCAPLERNDATPVAILPELIGTFGASLDWERLDIPNCGATLLAYRVEVAEILEPWLAPFGEFHRCSTELGDMGLFRCLNIVDALASDVTTMTHPDGFGLTKEFRFDPDRIPRGEVFTMPHQQNLPQIMYPDEFIAELDRAGIKYSPFALMFDEATGFFETSHW